MPISVSCPSCSASFNVKDEHAGKRARCPKCGGPITVPMAGGPTDTVKMPPGALPARPPAAPEPRRAEDGDERPTAKRRRDDDGDETPRSTRRRDGEEDGDKPKNRRRRGDDEDRPKKKSKLPLILGILGGVLLLCGGGGAALVWAVSEVRAAAKRAKEREAAQSTAPATGTTPGNVAGPQSLSGVRAGMTAAQVEEVLGRGQRGDGLVADATFCLGDIPAQLRWQEAAAAGRTMIWQQRGGDRIVVAFADDGTVSGVMGRFGGVGSEPVPLPEQTAKVEDGDVVELSPMRLAAEFAQDQAAAEKRYAGKSVRLVGRGGTVIGSTMLLGGFAVNTPGAAGPVYAECHFDPGVPHPPKQDPNALTVVVGGYDHFQPRNGNQSARVVLKGCKVEK